MMQSSPPDYAVFTVCNVAYLHKALLLAESLQKFNGLALKIFLIDRTGSLDGVVTPAEFIWIEDVGVPNLREMAFRYDITEFSTAVKPYLALHLLEQHQKVVFLDPDTCLYSPIDSILLDLDARPIVLTPHFVTPHVEGDVGMMRFGSFNLGFFAVRRSDESLNFLRWWSARCFELCYFETQFGLSTDQKWISIAPCFFRDLDISFNLGYNMAFWNTHERSLSKDGDGKYIVNDRFPLIFFHFSSFDEKNPEFLSKRPFAAQRKGRGDIVEISTDYARRHEIMKASCPKTPYAFDYMSDGSYISPTLRRAYACIQAELPAGHDPFDAAGPVGDFARKNHLFEKRSKAYVSNSFADVQSHKTAFSIIYFLLRSLLRVIGPNRFANFSRLLVYLSSYRQTRNLWRL